MTKPDNKSIKLALKSIKRPYFRFERLWSIYDINIGPGKENALQGILERNLFLERIKILDINRIIKIIRYNKLCF